jgi:RNA polymerase sigma-70 factor (ECF subfamily)
MSNLDINSAIRGGDQTAFRLYYEQRLVYLVARSQRLTGDRDEAWDIAQDTFVKLWECRERIDINKSLDGFLVAIATNAACDANRKKQVHARYHREQLFTRNDEWPSADAKIIKRQTQQKIDEVIKAMPVQRRTVYLLSREEGLTYNEIAQRMGISHGTVHKHMKIALEELRGLLSVLFVLLHIPLT